MLLIVEKSLNLVNLKAGAFLVGLRKERWMDGRLSRSGQVEGFGRSNNGENINSSLLHCEFNERKRAKVTRYHYSQQVSCRLGKKGTPFNGYNAMDTCCADRIARLRPGRVDLLSLLLQ